MNKHVTRKLSLFLALVMALTLVMSVAVFADTLEDVPVYDGNGEQLGTCNIEYTPNQEVELDVDWNQNSEADFKVTVVKPEAGSSLEYYAPREEGGTGNVSWKMKFEFADDAAVLDPTKDIDDYKNGSAGYLGGLDYTFSYVLTAILNNPIQGLPSTLSTGIHHFDFPTVTVAEDNITALHGTGFTSQFVKDTGWTPYKAEPCEEEPVNYGSPKSEPAADASPATVALATAKARLVGAVNSLKNLSPEGLAMAKQTGFDLDLRQVPVLDAESVALLMQTNVLPYNIVFEFQGQPMICRVPAGFDFSKYVQPDGTLLLKDIIWAILSKQLKLG